MNKIKQLFWALKKLNVSLVYCMHRDVFFLAWDLDIKYVLNLDSNIFCNKVYITCAVIKKYAIKK